MPFDVQRCTCGAIMVNEDISLKDGEKPYVALARAVVCPMCKRLVSMKTVGNGIAGITIGHIERIYKACPCSFYTVEELRAGLIDGYRPIKSRAYNPDAYIERDTQEVPL